MDKSQTNLSTSDVDEAKMVVETANHYLSQWPDCWSTFHPDQVCILARSHQQVCSTLTKYLHDLDNCGDMVFILVKPVIKQH